jgi:hypothetical protein
VQWVHHDLFTRKDEGKIISGYLPLTIGQEDKNYTFSMVITKAQKD